MLPTSEVNEILTKWNSSFFWKALQQSEQLKLRKKIVPKDIILHAFVLPLNSSIKLSHRADLDTFLSKLLAIGGQRSVLCRSLPNAVYLLPPPDLISWRTQPAQFYQKEGAILLEEKKIEQAPHIFCTSIYIILVHYSRWAADTSISLFRGTLKGSPLFHWDLRYSRQTWK